MNRTEPHPLEVLLVACWLAVEAAVTLVAALVALALTLVSGMRTGMEAAAQTGEAPATQQEEPISPVRVMTPAPHPLAVLAEQLEATCTRRQLQAMAGTRSNLSKATLAGMVAACS